MLPCVPLSNHFFSSPHAAHNPSHTCSVQYHVCLLPPACCCSESLRLRHWRVGVAVGRIRQRQAGAVRCYCFLLWCCKPVQAAGCDEHAHTETQTQGHRQRERDTHTHTRKHTDTHTHFAPPPMHCILCLCSLPLCAALCLVSVKGTRRTRTASRCLAHATSSGFPRLRWRW